MQNAYRVTPGRKFVKTTPIHISAADHSWKYDIGFLGEMVFSTEFDHKSS